MEPGVPFALLGAVQLLLVAACVGLAAAAGLRRSTAGALVALGALVLAAVEVRTALQLGVPASDDLALVRAAASLVLGAGLVTGGLGSRQTPTSAYGVVVPLAATGGPASFAAAGSVVAGAAALWNRRDLVGVAFGTGFLLWAAAAGLGPVADSGQAAPVTLMALRGVGALAVLVGLAVLAQASLLSKVVGAILAGVLAMAVAAVGVIGSVVVSSYDRQTREIVEQAATGRVLAIASLGQQAAGLAPFLEQVCNAALTCNSFLTQAVKTDDADFVVRVTRTGQVVSLGGRSALTPTELLGVRRLPVVTRVLGGSGASRNDSLFSNVRLAGASPGIAVIGVAASKARVGGLQSSPQSALVYGVRLDSDYTRGDVDTGGFGLTVMTGDPLEVVATNRSDNVAAQVLRIVRDVGADQGLPGAGLTVGSQGTNPTVRLVPLLDFAGQRVGVLAVSRDPGPALKTERDALRLLLITALMALLLVALAAAILGRRTVEPVRQLTAAAERVAAGDLTATTLVRSRDEVGTLSRTFDGMTASLSRLTGDLRDSAARLETVLASMSDGLLATDGDGVVTSVNRAALGMLGLEEQDVLGEPLSIVADVRDAAGGQLADPSRRLGDELAEVHRPDGSTVPVRVAITPLEGADGVVLVLRDTTREREVERMKTEFLSNVSHELRTPLTPIRGYAEILVAKPGLEPAQVTSFATTIRDESIKMNRVVDLLVDVAALEAGRVSVSPRTVTVKDLLDARLALWQTRAPLRAKDLKRRAAAGLPAVHVDPVWVGKALDELIDNAVKYTPAGTAITLAGAWSPDHTRVRVSVRDAGPGIAEDDHDSLFTSFEQVDGSATRRVGGLGLGLAFVRRLAEDAGYPLTVLSRPGKGAEFALDLPVADAAPSRRTGKG